MGNACLWAAFSGGAVRRRRGGGAIRRGMGSDGRGVGKMEIFWILSDLRK